MDEKCVCHINGYRLKDTEARKKATTAGASANAAMEKAMEVETKIAAAQTTANRAKMTADSAVVTAKGAYNAATAAEATATAAETTAATAETTAKNAKVVAENAASNVAAALDTAAAALPRKGGVLMGDIDMGQHNIRNATQVISKHLMANALDLEFKQNAGTTPPMLYRVGGVGDNVMTVRSYKKNLLTGEYNTAAPMDVIVRGVAPGVKENDAANVGQVLEMLGNVKGSDSGQNANIFAGRTAAFYGDSLTEENWQYTKGFHAWVSGILGLASYHNYGVGGYKIADVLNKVEAVDDPADIIFVQVGVNDRQFDTPLGTENNLESGTIYGNLHLLCAKLREKYPTKILVFITPAEQNAYPGSIGVSMLDIAAAVQTVCRRHAIVVYDNFTISEINGANLDFWTNDGCHWNDKAHEMVGKNLAHFVLNTFHYVADATSGGGGEDSGETNIVMSIIGDSLEAATYDGATLTMTGLKKTFCGAFFTGATTFEVDAQENSLSGNFGWFLVRQGDTILGIGTNGGTLETYEFDANLQNPTNKSYPSGVFPVSGTVRLKIEGANVKLYKNNSILYTTTGDCIGYATSATKLQTLTNVTIA